LRLEIHGLCEPSVYSGGSLFMGKFMHLPI
jgi:hypothetical protein